MYEIMFYHTSDSKASAIAQAQTLKDARRLLSWRAEEGYQSAYPMGKKVRNGKDRIEIRCDGWAMAYYIEKVAPTA